MHIDDYDAYLFDMDGTLTQTLAMWVPIVRTVLERYGIEASDRDIAFKVFGRARAGLLEYGVPEADIAAISKEWNAAALAAVVNVPLYPQAKELLAALHGRGKRVALITATVRPTAEKVLETHDIREFFDLVITGEDMPAPKPDPGGLLTALERLEIPHERAVMLGDSDKDIGAARNAGIDSVLFFPPEHHDFHARDQLLAEKPTYTIDSWQKLLNQLQ